jgi:hypothetical protein
MATTHYPVEAQARVRARDPSHKAFQVLHWGFVALPVIAGADKFFNLLARWDAYLSPAFASLSPLSALSTMRIVGVIEIVAGLLVLFKPRIGAYVVAGWLVAIIANLLLLGGAHDVALRDFGLVLGALALGWLSEAHRPG